MKLPEDVTYKDGSFTMNSTDYTNNRDKIDAKFNELTKEITQKAVPTVSIDNKRVNRKTVTQTITVTNPDGTSKDINDAYDHAVAHANNNFKRGLANGKSQVASIIILGNTYQKKVDGELQTIAGRTISFFYDPINNKLIQSDGTETDGLTEDQANFFKLPAYVFKEYEIPQIDGYTSYYSRKDSLDDTAIAAKVIPEGTSNDSDSAWYVLYEKNKSETGDPLIEPEKPAYDITKLKKHDTDNPLVKPENPVLDIPKSIKQMNH